MDAQRSRQTGKQAGRFIDGQTRKRSRQTGKQAGRFIDGQTRKQTGRQASWRSRGQQTNRLIDKLIGRLADGQTSR